MPAYFWLNLARLVIFVFTVLLGWMTYQSNLLLKRFRPDFNLLLSPPELMGRVLMVGLCLLLAWLTGLPASRLGLVAANPGREIGLGIAAGVVIQIGVNLLT